MRAKHDARQQQACLRCNAIFYTLHCKAMQHNILHFTLQQINPLWLERLHTMFDCTYIRTKN